MKWGHKLMLMDPPLGGMDLGERMRRPDGRAILQMAAALTAFCEKSGYALHIVPVTSESDDGKPLLRLPPAPRPS